MSRFLLLSLLATLLIGARPGYAQEPTETDEAPPAREQPVRGPRVRQIEVEGAGRLTRQEILRGLGLSEGQVLTSGSFEREILRLWESLRVGATIHLRDVPGSPGDVDLLVQVIEMPVDLEPRFVGHVEVSIEDIREWAGLIEGGELYLHEAPLVKRRIESGYRRKGYYFAEVRYVVGGEDDVSNDIIFDIHEGPRVKVKKMVLHGGEAMPDRGFWFWRSGLKRLAGVKLGGPSQVLRIKPAFVEEELEADLVAMRQVYRDRGWLDAVVELERLEFNDARTRVVIHVAIDEGPRYRVGSLAVEAYEVYADAQAPGGLSFRRVDPLIPEEELVAACGLVPGEVFEQVQVNRDQTALQNLYSGEGRISDPSLPPVERWQFLPPEYVYDVDAHEVHVVYRVAEGRPIFIREILFSGNLHTRDRVLRRELSFFPGELANIKKIRESLGRIRSTDYFTDTRNPLAHTPPHFRFRDTQDPSWKDIEFIVEEGNVLQFQFSGGVGDTNGAFINASVTMSNFDASSLPSSFGNAIHEVGAKEAFHGDGQAFRIFAAPGTDVSQFGFRWYHPDIFARHLERISFDFDGSRRVRRFDDYREQRDQLGFAFGRQLDLRSWISAGYTYQEVEIDDLDKGGLPSLGNPLAVPQLLKDVEGKNKLPYLTVDWVKRTIDSRLNPRTGYSLSAAANVYDGAWGSDFDFVSTRVSGEFYGLFGEEGEGVRHGWRVAGQLGIAAPYGDTEDVPYTERFFIGGSRSLRGFSYRGVGPNENGDAIGGETMLAASLEYRIPLHTIAQPGTYEELEAIRLGFFVDAGLLDPDPFSLDFSELRASAGFLLGIPHPLPFYFSFGFPIEKGEGDDTRVFNFEFGF